MKDDFRLMFHESMNSLQLSEEAKEHLVITLSERAADDRGKDVSTMKRKGFRRGIALALAAALLVGTLSAGAVYWASRSRSLEAELHMTEDQRQWAEESGLSASPDNARAAGEVTSATDNGVTVTVEQTIVDNYFAMLAFRIDGYAVPEGQDPDIGDLQIELVDGAPVNWSGGFYDGLVSENGRAAHYDDGSPLEYDENGSLIRRYAADDGSLRYHVMLMGNGSEDSMEKWSEGMIAGSLIGKEIEVRFEGIGTGDKAEYFPDLDGHWDLRWTLTGSDEVRTVRPEQEIGDSGAVLAEADISPISLRAAYRIPEEMEKAILAAVDDDEVVPRLLGVRLKDGTLYPYLFMGPGSSGSPGKNLYEMRFAIDRVLNTGDVDALVFLKSYPKDGETLTEENLYIVPVENSAG